MTVLVDTSVWSLALRRAGPERVAEVDALAELLRGADLVATTGIVLQELLQGSVRADTRELILERFRRLTFVMPTPDDHVGAARVRTTCRERGVQLGTVDALIAQLCIRHGLTLLTTDGDFTHAANHVPLRVWSP